METLRVVSFPYEQAWYSVEPFVYGKAMDGNDVLLAYVVRGNPGLADDDTWKVFISEKMGHQVINYNSLKADREGRPEVAFAEIYCQVKPKPEKKK